jgi:predicted RNA binding protein YcfA (HicA-like mRNA interferase family)
MSSFPSSNARKVLRALERIGWREKARISKSGSHRQLQHPDFHYEYTVGVS